MWEGAGVAERAENFEATKKMGTKQKEQKAGRRDAKDARRDEKERT